MSSPAPGAPALPYRIYRDFLTPEEHAAILAWALDNHARFTPATVGGSARVIDQDIRQAFTLSDLGALGPTLEGRVRSIVPELLHNFSMAPFDINGIELELVAYNDGAYYARHIDVDTARMPRGGDRVLSGVYYFYREPKSFSGGELRMHRLGSGGGQFPDIVPEQNCFVAFHSWWPHEVRPALCPSHDFADSRFAVNCWVYRARREKQSDPRREDATHCNLK